MRLIKGRKLENLLSNVRKAIEDLEIGVREFEEISGVYDHCLNRFFDGDYKGMRWGTALKIAKLLDTTVEELWKPSQTKPSPRPLTNPAVKLTKSKSREDELLVLINENVAKAKELQEQLVDLAIKRRILIQERELRRHPAEILEELHWNNTEVEKYEQV